MWKFKSVWWRRVCGSLKVSGGRGVGMVLIEDQQHELQLWVVSKMRYEQNEELVVVESKMRYEQNEELVVVESKMRYEQNEELVVVESKMRYEQNEELVVVESKMRYEQNEELVVVESKMRYEQNEELVVVESKMRYEQNEELVVVESKMRYEQNEGCGGRSHLLHQLFSKVGAGQALIGFYCVLACRVVQCKYRMWVHALVKLVNSFIQRVNVLYHFN